MKARSRFPSGLIVLTDVRHDNPLHLSAAQISEVRPSYALPGQQSRVTMTNGNAYEVAEDCDRIDQLIGDRIRP